MKNNQERSIRNTAVAVGVVEAVEEVVVVVVIQNTVFRANFLVNMTAILILKQNKHYGNMR